MTRDQADGDETGDACERVERSDSDGDGVEDGCDDCDDCEHDPDPSQLDGGAGGAGRRQAGRATEGVMGRLRVR